MIPIVSGGSLILAVAAAGDCAALPALDP